MRFNSSSICKNILLISLVLMLSVANFSNSDVYAALGVSVVKINDQVIDANGLNFSEGNHGLYPNSAIFSMDAIISHNNYQYATYYNSSRRVCVARRRISPKTAWSIIEFTDYNYQATDTHNTAVMGICREDGTIHLAWDHHVSSLHYRVSVQGAATNPESVEWSTALFGSVTSQLVPGINETKVTYPVFIDVPNGNLQLLRRDGGSGNGDTILYTYNGTTHSWVKNGIIISRDGNYNGSTSRNAYLDRPQYHNNKIYVTWVWREETDSMTNHDIMFAYSEDFGLTWKNNSGNIVSTTQSNPLNISTTGLKVWTINTNHGLMNQGYSYLDTKGQVHVITSHAPEDNPDYANWSVARADAKYTHYWRGIDGVWHQNKMNSLSLGSRPNLLIDRNNTAYIIYSHANRLRIAAATEDSNWTNWGIIYSNAGVYTQSPLVDFEGWKSNRIMSVFAQEIPDVAGWESAIHVYDFIEETLYYVDSGFRNSDNEIMTSLQDGSYIKAIVKAYNGTNEEANAVIILALFDKNTKELIKIDVQNYTIPAKTANQIITAGLTLPENETKNYMLKRFVFESIDSIKPIIGATVIP